MFEGWPETGLMQITGSNTISVIEAGRKSTISERVGAPHDPPRAHRDFEPDLILPARRVGRAYTKYPKH